MIKSPIFLSLFLWFSPLLEGSSRLTNFQWERDLETPEPRIPFSHKAESYDQRLNSLSESEKQKELVRLLKLQSLESEYLQLSSESPGDGKKLHAVKVKIWHELSSLKVKEPSSQVQAISMLFDIAGSVRGLVKDYKKAMNIFEEDPELYQDHIFSYIKGVRFGLNGEPANPEWAKKKLLQLHYESVSREASLSFFSTAELTEEKLKFLKRERERYPKLLLHIASFFHFNGDLKSLREYLPKMEALESEYLFLTPVIRLFQQVLLKTEEEAKSFKATEIFAQLEAFYPVEGTSSGVHAENLRDFQERFDLLFTQAKEEKDPRKSAESLAILMLTASEVLDKSWISDETYDELHAEFMVFSEFLRPQDRAYFWEDVILKDIRFILSKAIASMTDGSGSSQGQTQELQVLLKRIKELQDEMAFCQAFAKRDEESPETEASEEPDPGELEKLETEDLEEIKPIERKKTRRELKQEEDIQKALARRDQAIAFGLAHSVIEEGPEVRYDLKLLSSVEVREFERLKEESPRFQSLLEDIERCRWFGVGIGKPKALKGRLAGWFSRRMTYEDRLVYRDLPAHEETVRTIQIRSFEGHYDD